MAGLITQFHALLDELVAFVVDTMNRFPIQATAFCWPFQAVPIATNMAEAALQNENTRMIAFTLDAPRLPTVTMGEFLDNNPGALLLDIGRLSERGLQQSCLSVRKANELQLKVWKQIARKLRNATQAGAIAVNPMTGATCKIRIYRYTKGAKALDDQGVPMRPFAGTAVLHFGGGRE